MSTQSRLSGGGHRSPGPAVFKISLTSFRRTQTGPTLRSRASSPTFGVTRALSASTRVSAPTPSVSCREPARRLSCTKTWHTCSSRSPSRSRGHWSRKLDHWHELAPPQYGWTTVSQQAYWKATGQGPPSTSITQPRVYCHLAGDGKVCLTPPVFLPPKGMSAKRERLYSPTPNNHHTAIPTTTLYPPCISP